ncbi:MAG: hypothetical protein M3R36_10525 [Bacteroidota bacterium]|nr:hypothetical protein [Bacteroidota bacterium]
MKNLLKFFVAVFLLISLFQTGYSQIPTYTLTAKNFKTNCYNNQLEWDIYLKHTNPPTIFWYVGGQYFFNFDTSVSNGGTLTYEIIGSDFIPSIRPRNPSVAVYNGQTVLRLAANLCIGLGLCGIDITNNGSTNDSNGTLVVKMRLTTSTYFSFEKTPDFIQWRNYPSANPITKINVYIGMYNTEITTPNTHLINIPGGTINKNIIQYIPSHSSEGVYYPVKFSWSKFNCNNLNRYKLEVARDYSFNDKVFNDSNLIDTFKIVNGFLSSSVYYWRISGFNIDSNKFNSPSSIYKFKTTYSISIKMKIMLEGIYEPGTLEDQGSFPITVYLRETNPPFTVRDSAHSNVNLSDNRIYPGFPRAISGNYYIVLKTINGIETWSREGGEQLSIENSYEYNFIDSSSQAYGNNLKLKGNYYCMYSGDVNQDGMIELEDLKLIDNDITNSVTGLNVPSDLNYDEVVDLTDLSICDNNVFDFITLIRP